MGACLGRTAHREVDEAGKKSHVSEDKLGQVDKGLRRKVSSRPVCIQLFLENTLYTERLKQSENVWQKSQSIEHY